MLSETISVDEENEEEDHFIKSTLIIGLGNVDRHDDGIGIYCAEKLQQQYPKLPIYHEQNHLIDEIILKSLQTKSIQNVLFIDACDFGASPGDTKVVKNPDSLVDELSSHKFPLPLYMRLLKREGKSVVVLGIQVNKVDFVHGLTEKLGDFLDFEFLDLFESIVSEFN